MVEVLFRLHPFPECLNNEVSEFQWFFCADTDTGAADIASESELTSERRRLAFRLPEFRACYSCTKRKVRAER